ncbi:unnamed protein product [Effrenium voratum]|nr:unnamed protein product [Effrenium voratum]
MPKTGTKTTHKHTLKLKNREPTDISNDGIFSQAISQAKSIHQLSKLDWGNFVSGCSTEELKSMKTYMKENKANFVCKVERLAEQTGHIKTIMKVRDYLNEAIVKSMDLTNDATIVELEKEELDQNTQSVCQLLDNEFKRRDERAKVLNEVAQAKTKAQPQNGAKPMAIG